jgi:hypothetical protein
MQRVGSDAVTEMSPRVNWFKRNQDIRIATARRPISPLVRSDLRDAFSHFRRKSVFVVDDLPEGDVTDRLDEALALLGHICSELSFTLLTTAARSLSQYVRDRAPSFSEVSAPPFSDEDVVSLLKLFGASGEHLKPWFVKYIKLVTHNSPLLLRAAAQHCEAKGWPLVEKDRRWPAMLEKLDELTNKASCAKARPLIAGLVRAQIIILMDYLRDADRAGSLARKINPLLKTEATGEFLVASTIGQQYCFLNLRTAAEPWLDRAVELERHGQVTHRIYTFLYAGIVKAGSSLSDSATLILHAADIALSNEDVPWTLKVRALGERAIALWRMSGLGSAYESLRDAAEMLLESDLLNEKERSLFQLFGNSLGYFMRVASGELPEQQFLVPAPGLYLDYSSRFAESFTSDKVWLMAAQIANLAEALGHGFDAAKFAMRGLARPDVKPETRWLLAFPIITQRAADGDYAGIVGLWSALTADPMPSGAPLGAESGIAEIAIIVIGFSLAALKLRDEAAIGPRVAAATFALGDVSDSVPAAEKFHRAASLIEKAFASALGGDQLIEIGKKQESSALHLISYLGAMFKLSPTGAFLALRAMLSTLKTLPKGMYRVLVVPFVRSFWSVTFERNTFAFSAPKLVKRQIEEALAIEGEASVGLC